MLAHHVFWHIDTGDFVSILLGLFVAVPASIAAWAAVKGRRQMKTSNGHTAGELLDDIREDMSLMKMWMTEHMRLHDIHVITGDKRDARDESRRDVP